MVKRRSLEGDVAILKKKVTESRSKSENVKSDKGVRMLHKHLKRAQRKIRSRAARIAQAAGKKKTSTA